MAKINFETIHAYGEDVYPTKPLDFSQNPVQEHLIAEDAESGNVSLVLLGQNDDMEIAGMLHADREGGPYPLKSWVLTQPWRGGG